MDRARIELLQQMPIFGAIDDEALQFLLDPVSSVSVPKGGFFFRERDPADGMYVLESGRVSVVKEWAGRELLLHRLDAGDCFGEMALLDLFPRSASVRAEADCRAIVLTPAQLYRLYEHDPKPFALIQMLPSPKRMRSTPETMPPMTKSRRMSSSFGRTSLRTLPRPPLRRSSEAGRVSGFGAPARG